MRMRSVVLLASVLCVVCLVSFGIAASDDSMEGTWKLNPADSRYSPGPSPKDVVLTIEPAGGDALKITTQTMEPDGKQPLRQPSLAGHAILIDRRLQEQRRHRPHHPFAQVARGARHRQQVHRRLAMYGRSNPVRPKPLGQSRSGTRYIVTN